MNFRRLQAPECSANRGGSTAGFSLLEVMVSAAIFVAILGLVIGIMSQTSSLWLRHRHQASAFEAAQAAFETMTRTLSQAILNTYWEVDTTSNSFSRESDLHFVMGPADDLLGVNSERYPGSAIFFQASLGRALDTSLKRLPLLLNSAGYFVHFGDAPDTPGFLPSPERYRFRLFEWLQPTERMATYQGGNRDWFQNDLSSGNLGNAVALAENVIAIVLLAEYPTNGTTIAFSYAYDSRDTSSDLTLHQLPPRVRVVMAVIDEASATRLAAEYRDAPPPVGPPASMFENPSDFDGALKQWETNLASVTPRIDFRIFSATVMIQNAKWSLPAEL